MNPFSKRIHQIKNPDLDLPKGTRNPFLDLKSVFGFTERNTPLNLFVFVSLFLSVLRLRSLVDRVCHFVLMFANSYWSCINYISSVISAIVIVEIYSVTPLACSRLRGGSERDSRVSKIEKA